MLYWKRWVDRHGLPYDGGWVNQPQLFLLDIDAATSGEKMRANEKDVYEKKIFLDVLTDIRALLRSSGG